MKRFIVKFALMSGVGLGALGLAGCNTAQEQAALSGINAICTGLAIGTQVIVTITSSLAPGISQIAQTVAQGATNVCPVLVAGAQGVIDQITQNGGTATVTASTTSPAGVQSHYMMRMSRNGTDGPYVWVVPAKGRYTARNGARGHWVKMGAAAGGQIAGRWVVPPK